METTAFEADTTLKKIVGTDALSEIFTAEKIAACQKVIDDAKSSFFETAQADMDVMTGLMAGQDFTRKHQELCKQLLPAISNIKGQATMFGYGLISKICHYLLEYCEESAKKETLSKKDTFILSRLLEALQHAFREKIVDSGGKLERELIATIELARK